LFNIKPVIKFTVDVLMLCCYCLFFGMVTRSFMLQGLIAYHGQIKR
jgi:hypothetical protein